jgi:hypothetical protein
MKTLLCTSFLLLATTTAWASANPPVYPGAVAATRPAAVGLKTPPASSKTYATSDAYATVEAWYKAHLNGAMEVHQPAMEKSEAAFLVGDASNGKIVYIQRYNGKTWIVIGPAA